MAQVTLKIDDKDVFGSGSVTVQPGQSPSFYFGDLILKLAFIEAEGAEPAVESVVEDDKILILKMKNFDNPRGTTYSSELGTFDHRRLEVSITVHAVGQKPATKLINYTFSLGRAVDGE